MNSENSGRAGTGSHEAAESGAFALTDWDAVWEVEQPGARGARALERLCSAYWRPLVNHLLRSGIQSADAEDLVQGFFVDFLQKRGFSRALGGTEVAAAAARGSAQCLRGGG